MAIRIADDLDAKVAYYQTLASGARNTTMTYDACWRHFVAWCEAHGRASLPATPETVASYLATHAGEYKTSTMRVWMTTITRRHQLAGYETPAQHDLVRTVYQGIRREHGAPGRQRAPLLLDDLRTVAALWSEDTPGQTRDRAILLVGFAGAFRAGELRRLELRDIAESADGLTLTVRRSKTDQIGFGRIVGIPRGNHPETCPVLALNGWLHHRGLTHGPLFIALDRAAGSRGENRLTRQSISAICKAAAAALGYDPNDYGSHSLRAGLVTSAALAGTPEWIIQQQTGHQQVESVRGYIRRGNLFQTNAAKHLDL